MPRLLRVDAVVGLLLRSASYTRLALVARFGTAFDAFAVTSAGRSRRVAADG